MSEGRGECAASCEVVWNAEGGHMVFGKLISVNMSKLVNANCGCFFIFARRGSPHIHKPLEFRGNLLYDSEEVLDFSLHKEYSL